MRVATEGGVAAASGARCPRLMAALLLAVALALLSGCAGTPPEAEWRTASQWLDARGEPTGRWPTTRGTTLLEYGTQPEGDTCWMVEIDAAGTVLRQWDALSEDNLARVQRGMTTTEVRNLLGPKRSEVRFDRSGETVWDWTIDARGLNASVVRFNVHFVDGRVVRTSRSSEDLPGGVRFGFGIGSGGGWGFGIGVPLFGW